MSSSARSLKSALLAAAFLSAGFAAFAQQPAAGTEATKGRDLYLKYCVSCHGKGGVGDGPAASALKIAPADLTAISRKYNGFPGQKVMDWIDGEKYAVGHGSREMPVWGRKFRQAGEIESLAAYLESIQKK